MRIATGGMLHESNTFTRENTPFEAFHTVRGDDVYESSRWMTGRATGGIVDTLSEHDAEIVPTFFAKALPSGTVRNRAYQQITTEITDGIEASLPVDAVCLDLHGSMYVDGCDDPEGKLLESVRELVGEATPIVCSLDMHATITDRFIEHVDGVTGYRTAPHTDVYETGERAAALVLELLERDLDPVVEWLRLPMLIAGEQSETDAAPMDQLIDRLRETERRPGILSTSYFLGFPWADSPHNGVSTIVVGTRTAVDDVRATASELATEWWDHRHEFGFTTEAYPLEDALDVADAESAAPVVVADSGDNPTAGASEDLTIVLERVLEREHHDALIAVVVDDDAVSVGREAGEGATVSLELGRAGTEPDATGVALEAEVRRVGVADGISAVVLDVEGTTVVVTAERTSVTDPTFLDELGVSPEAYELVVVKSGYLSPAYQRLAARTILALTPGETNEVLSELPYEDTPRPIYPLDDEVTWTPTGRQGR